MYRTPRRTVAVLGAVALLVGMVAPAAPASTAPTIRTFAGGGVGDGRPPLSTHITSLLAVGTNAAGNIYWSENESSVGANRIRMFDAAAGVVRSVAGTGLLRGVGGENRIDVEGPASDIALWDAAGVGADSKGNVYVFDSQNWRFRRVDAATGRAKMIHAPDFVFPDIGTPVEVDSKDRVYFASQYTVRRFDPRTGAIETIVGGGSLPLDADGVKATEVRINAPEDIELDDEGNLYLVEGGVVFSNGSSFYNGPRIRWVDTQGFIHTLAGGHRAHFTDDGQYAYVTKLEEPAGHRLLAQPDGSLWYTDGEKVRRIDGNQELWLVPGSRRVTTVFTITGGFKDGPLAQAEFGSIVDWETYGEGFVVADHLNRRIRLVEDGQVSTIVGDGLPTVFNEFLPDAFDWTGDGLPATDAHLSVPCDVATLPSGEVLISETGLRSQVLGRLGFHSRIRLVDPRSGRISTFAGTEHDGYSGDGSAATSARLRDPCGMAVAPNGDVFIADTGNNVVRKVDGATGVITTVAGRGTPGSSGDGGAATAAELNAPWDVAVDPQGALYITESEAHRIRRVDPSGIITTVAGGGDKGFAGDGREAVSAVVNGPRGIEALPDGSVIFADTFNHRIRKISPAGIISTIAGTGGSGEPDEGVPWKASDLAFPIGVAVDPQVGAIFVSVRGSQQLVRRLDPDGLIRTVAGNGDLDMCGDGGPALDACLRNPTGLTVTPGGSLLVADMTNLRVREVRGLR